MSTNIIGDESPHLASALKTAAPESDFALLDAAFNFSIQHGGRAELDFVREIGVSYNPRPARIGLILLKIAGITKSTVLAGGILATAHDSIAEAVELLPKDVVKLARDSQLPTAVLFGKHLDGQAKDEPAFAAIIAVALHLDRARHIHMGPAEASVWRNFLDETVQYVTLARWCSPPIAILLEAWTVRFARKVAALDI